VNGLDELVYRERPAAGDPQGLLVLLHGRGANEHDLFPLLDWLDPQQRLLGVTPRAPLSLPPGGAHWYVVREVGFPDPDTFFGALSRASAWLDALAAEAGLSPEQVVIGGFSQGSVMSYALGLGRGRPRPAGVLALSGFIPVVEGFQLDLEPPIPPVAIGHGSYDPVIPVDFGRRARAVLEAAGADVLYRESPVAHTIDPELLVELRGWIAGRITQAPARG
jgi:phospholipase/carboxylesterase